MNPFYFELFSREHFRANKFQNFTSENLRSNALIFSFSFDHKNPDNVGLKDLKLALLLVEGNKFLKNLKGPYYYLPNIFQKSEIRR